jgi:hypothetical protein
MATLCRSSEPASLAAHMATQSDSALSPRQAAALLGVHVGSVRRWIYAGLPIRQETLRGASALESRIASRPARAHVHLLAGGVCRVV